MCHLFSVEAQHVQSTCPCKQLCHYVQYEPSLSYAQLSKFNIDRMVLNDPQRRDLVHEKFLAATELSQRKVAEVAEADEVNLLEIQRLVNTLLDDIRLLNPVLSSDTEYAKYYHIFSFLARGSAILKQDAYRITAKLEEISEPLKKVEADVCTKLLVSINGELLGDKCHT